jgi:maleylacetoacetate isomerase
LKLYNFYQSSASFRVRIGLALKGVAYEYVPVALSLAGGANRTDDYKATNAQQLVPTLVDGELVITQSLAIFDHLDRKFPEPALYPADPAGRSRVLSLCLFVACEIQPLQNLRVERYLEAPLGMDAAARATFKRHFQAVGFDVVEAMLADGQAGRFCHGDAPTAADAFVAAQAPGVERNGLALDRWPTIARVVANCREHPAFIAAAPANQPDAPR